MEFRQSRGRRGGWKRGGRGGHDGDGFGGEQQQRGRGRGGQHRGRGRRDHHRGRGRGGGGLAAEPHFQAQDEGVNIQEEDAVEEFFSRRKLESNWDRYAESEKQEPDDGTPAQRGTDYHVLLGSAGDSFTQFRFSEEKDWEMDSFAAGQVSAVFLDLQGLAQSFQRVPLHRRLNLEAELVQVSTPVELPAVTLAPKQEKAKASTFSPPAAALKGLGVGQKASAAPAPAPAAAPAAPAPAPTSGRGPPVSTMAAEPPADDGDEELDQLLGLRTPVPAVTEEGSAAPEGACEEMGEAVPAAIEEKTEEVKDKDVPPPPPKPAPAKQELTEEDLEDWLDSMIS